MNEANFCNKEQSPEDRARTMEKQANFQKELAALLNKYSAENGSNTPDFILASYLKGCLDVFDNAIAAREVWYGNPCGNGIITIDEKGNVDPPSAVPLLAGIQRLRQES